MAAALVIAMTSSSSMAFPTEGAEQQVRYKKLQGKMKGVNKKLARRLELTDEQKQQIAEINAQHQEQRSVNKETMIAYKEQLNSLLLAPIFDQQAYTDLRNQYQLHFSEAALLRAKHQHQFMQVLDSDQQKKMLLIPTKVKSLF